MHTKEIKTGDVVKGNRHSHPMTVRTVEGNNVVVDYFVEGELNRETYNLEDLRVKTI